MRIYYFVTSHDIIYYISNDKEKKIIAFKPLLITTLLKIDVKIIIQSE